MSKEFKKKLMPIELACERLKLPSNSTPSQIESAYKKLSVLFHPDKQGGDASKFNELTEARDSMLAYASKNSPLKIKLQELLKIIDEKIVDGTVEQRNNLQMLSSQAFDLINHKNPDEAELKKLHDQITNIFLAIEQQNEKLVKQYESILLNWEKEVSVKCEAWVQEKKLRRPDIECQNKVNNIQKTMIMRIEDDKTLYSSTPEKLKEYLDSRTHEVLDEINKWWFGKGYEVNYEEKYSSDEQASPLSEESKNKKQNERKKQNEDEKIKQEEDMRFEQQKKDEEDVKNEQEEQLKQENSTQSDSNFQYESSGIKSETSKTKYDWTVKEDLYKRLTSDANSNWINLFCQKNNYEFIDDKINRKIIFQTQDKETKITVQGGHIGYQSPLDGDIEKHRIAMIDIYVISINPNVNSNHVLTCTTKEGLDMLERLLAQQLRARNIEGTINHKSIEEILNKKYKKPNVPDQEEIRKDEPEHTNHNKM